MAETRNHKLPTFHSCTCLLTTFSTVDRLRGTIVELSMYLLSWPVYTTRPKQQQNNHQNEFQQSQQQHNCNIHKLMSKRKKIMTKLWQQRQQPAQWPSTLDNPDEQEPEETFIN